MPFLWMKEVNTTIIIKKMAKMGISMMNTLLLIISITFMIKVINTATMTTREKSVPMQ